MVKARLEENDQELHLKKQEVFVVNNSELHKAEARARGVNIASGGLEILGFPIGKKEFIQEFIKSKVGVAIVILKSIGEVDLLGRLIPRWSAPQKLYQMVKDCANQLLRHLLKAVDPELLREEMARLDAVTGDVVCRIIGVSREEDSEWIRARFALPIRYQGLGITSLAENADAAYVGTVNACALDIRVSLLPNLSAGDVSGLASARERLSAELDTEEVKIVPSIECILDGIPPGEERIMQAATDPKGRKREEMSTAWTLSEYLYKKKRFHVEGNLAGLQLFALQQVTNPTSADFLGACTSSNSREVDFKWKFNMAVRLYLGLPVTSHERKIEKCNEEQMVPNGDHSGHVRCSWFPR